MSILLTYNGSTYIIPSPGELGWGSNLDSFFVAVAAGSLQKTGGSFTLSAEADFGGSFGLKSLYLKSRSPNIASSGILRLANGDNISWRNNLNTLDLPLSVNASNQLTFNGVPVGGTLPAFTANRAIVSDGTGVLVVSATTDTEIGYISGVTSGIQSQLNDKAPSADPIFTGQALFDDGLVSAPSISFSSDIVTGLFHPALNTLALVVNSTIGLKVNPDGSVNKPLQPSFLVKNGVGATDVTGDGTNYQVPFPITQYDTTSSFSVDTFTAPVTGDYIFTATVLLDGLVVPTMSDIAITIQTSTESFYYEFVPAAGVTTHSVSLTAQPHLVIGDTVKVFVKVLGGSKVVDIFAFSGGNFFSGTLLN